MWPFRKKQVEMTLKTRVTEFWKWYAQHAAAFLTTIDDDRCSDLEPEVSAAVDRWLPGMAWVFGPGENGIGHSFTLSGEGIKMKQMVAEYWLAQAPRLEGWTFYASRQPSSDVRKYSLRFAHNLVFQPNELWLRVTADDEEEKIDITAWHPLYSEISESDRNMSIFLLLDETLGEHGTQNWIGQIEFADTHLKESIPIWELPELIEKMQKEKEWKKHKPTDTYSSYHVDESVKGLRGDVFVGSTRCMDLVRDYRRARGPVDHPVPDVGMDLVFVAFTNVILPKGSEVEFRCAISDDIAAVFQRNASGDALGGAMGRANAYIDFVIYDGQNSMGQILGVLRKHGLPRGTTIHYFTKEKKGQVRRL